MNPFVFVAAFLTYWPAAKRLRAGMLPLLWEVRRGKSEVRRGSWTGLKGLKKGRGRGCSRYFGDRFAAEDVLARGCGDAEEGRIPNTKRGG